jgi:hypothetical protein
VDVCFLNFRSSRRCVAYPVSFSGQRSAIILDGRAWNHAGRSHSTAGALCQGMSRLARRSFVSAFPCQRPLVAAARRGRMDVSSAGCVKPSGSLLKADQLTGTHRQPDIAAIDPFGCAPFTCKHPFAALVRLVDDAEILTAVENRRNFP